MPARVSQKLDAVRRGRRALPKGHALGRRATPCNPRRRRLRPRESLGFAVGAMADGFVLGMLLPATQIEDERLGEVSDSRQSRGAARRATRHSSTPRASGRAALSEGAEDIVEILEGEAPGEAAESGDSTGRAGEVAADLDSSRPTHRRDAGRIEARPWLSGATRPTGQGAPREQVGCGQRERVWAGAASCLNSPRGKFSLRAVPRRRDGRCREGGLRRSGR